MYLNDHTTDDPKLRLYLNLDNLIDLRADSLFPSALLAPEAVGARDARLSADRFAGVQLTAPAATAATTILPFCGLGRINTAAEAGPLARAHTERGDQCLTVLIGWGIEDDVETARLVEATLTASQKYQLPIFIETYRATVTQDMWRTVQ